MRAEVKPLRGRDAVLAALGHDVFARCDVAPTLLASAWTAGTAVAFLRRGHRRPTFLHFLSDNAGDLRRLFAHFSQTGLPEPAQGVAVEPAFLDLVEQYFTCGSGGDWAWLWTTGRAPVMDLPTGFDLVELDDSADLAELIALNERGSPGAESEPGAGATERWFGVRRGGQLVAAGAMHRTDGGAPHLAGIVTDPEVRGRGLGAVVTAALTNAAVASDGICTLGVYRHNAVALRLYRRLGYRIAHEWCSRRIDVGGPD